MHRAPSCPWPWHSRVTLLCHSMVVPRAQADAYLHPGTLLVLLLQRQGSQPDGYQNPSGVLGLAADAADCCNAVLGEFALSTISEL